MKKRINIVVLTAVLALTGMMYGCGNKTQNIAVVTPATLPDLTDDRYPSDDVIGQHEERITLAFADAAPAPAEDFTCVEQSEGYAITSYTGAGIVVVIPETINNRPVVAVSSGAFEGHGSLRAVWVPDSVKAIGIGAFEGCHAMTTLRTPVICDGNAYPFFGALFGAESYEVNASFVPNTLATVILGDGVTVIPDYAFYDCHTLLRVALPGTLTEIGDFAFYGCESLGYADLSKTALVRVGERAFANCAALLRFDLPAAVTEIGAGAVEGCGLMESMTLPFVGGSETENTYLSYIFGAASYTFGEGYIPASLMTVKLLAGCMAIPDNAFYECSSVRTIILPVGVTSVGRRAFYGCERLQAVTLPDEVTTVGDDAFNGCIRLQSAFLGQRLTDMGVQAFMGCVSLTEVVLPESLTAIPASCFAGCISLVTVTAPGVTSVDSVGAQAYRHCDQLTDAPFLPVATGTEA